MSKRVNLPKQKSPLKVIRMMCIECMGGDSIQDCKDLIRDCASKACPNYEMRFGRNPYSKHRGNIGNFIISPSEKPDAREEFREIVA
jgi:hypothetical protein